MKQLEGKVALVTGATSGMGSAAAQAMAGEGASVVLVGRREAEGEQMAEEIRSQGGNALFVQTDVTVEDQVARLVEAASSTRPARPAYRELGKVFLPMSPPSTG